MKRSILGLLLPVCLTGLVTVSDVVAASAGDKNVHLGSPAWLGNLKLEEPILISIKKAMEKALESPIDTEQQCGEERMDCVVRAAREWTVDGTKYREIVINIHTVGHASNTISQSAGQWPDIDIK